MAVTPEYIKEKRKQNGWTQEDLADKMKVVVRTIKIWEKEPSSVPKSKEKYLVQVLENKEAPKEAYTVYIPKSEFLKTGYIIIKLTCLLLFIISCSPKKKDY